MTPKIATPDFNSILDQAVDSVLQNKKEKPSNETLIYALLEAEKYSKKTKTPIFLVNFWVNGDYVLLQGRKKHEKKRVLC